MENEKKKENPFFIFLIFFQLLQLTDREPGWNEQGESWDFRHAAKLKKKKKKKF